MGTADNFLLSLFVWEQTNTHTMCSSKTNTVHQAFSAAGNSHRWYSGSSFIRLWPLIPADDLHVERLQVLKSALWFPLAAGFCRVSQTHLKKRLGLFPADWFVLMNTSRMFCFRVDWTSTAEPTFHIWDHSVVNYSPHSFSVSHMFKICEWPHTRQTGMPAEETDAWQNINNGYGNNSYRQFRKEEVDRTCQQDIPSHTGSPERTDASERIHTET